MQRRRVLQGLAVAPLAALAMGARAAAAKKVAMLWSTKDGMPANADPELVRNEFSTRGSKEEEARKLSALLEPNGFRLGRNLDVQCFDFPFFSDWDQAVPRAVSRMIAAKPDCILASGTVFTRYVARATRTIPIVTSVGDPVAVGFAQSMARPGGNITGVALKLGVDLKTLEFLTRIMPGMSCTAWIGYREQVAHLPSFEGAAREIRLGARRILVEEPAPAGWQRKLTAEFQPLRAAGCTGIVLSASDPYLGEVAKLAIEHRIAVALQGPEEALARDGLLLHYYSADDGNERDRRMAGIVARVLKGEQPANIPFEGPSRYRLVINLKTARMIGATIPSDIHVLADRVISS